MKPILRAVSLLERASLTLAVLAMLAMMLSISADAFGRYLFNAPIEGAFEFTELYLMIVVTFMAMPDTYSSGAQIRLDIAADLLRRVPGRAVERLALAFAAAVTAVMFWYSMQTAIEKFAETETSFGAVQFRLDWSYVWVPVGTGLVALRMTLRALFLEPLDGPDDG